MNGEHEVVIPSSQFAGDQEWRSCYRMPGSSGYAFINWAFSSVELRISKFLKSQPSGQVSIVSSSELTIRHRRRPIANTPLLGAFAAITGMIELASVQSAMRQMFPGALGEANADAAQDGYDHVIASLASEGSGLPHARAN